METDKNFSSDEDFIDSDSEWSEASCTDDDEDDLEPGSSAESNRNGGHSGATASAAPSPFGSYEDDDPGPPSPLYPFRPKDNPGLKDLKTDGKWTRKSCFDFMSPAIMELICGWILISIMLFLYPLIFSVTVRDVGVWKKFKGSRK